MASYATDRRALGKTVGAMFRAARLAQHLSQHQVAALTDNPPVSRTTISSIESGRMPNLEALVSLSNVLHVNPMEVLERVSLASSVPVDLTDVDFEELGRQAEQMFWAADYRGALAVYDAMYQRLVLDPPDDAGEARRKKARIEINRAVMLMQCSALQASEASAKRAIELAKETPFLQAEAFVVLASLYSRQDILQLAELTANRAVALSRNGTAKLQGQSWNQMGNVLIRSGRAQEARTAFLQARKFAIQARDHYLRIKAEGNAGSCLLALDQMPKAKRNFQIAIELARKYDYPAAEAFWLIELGRLTLREGAVAQADRYAGAALRLAKPSGRLLTIFRAEWLRHQIVRARSPESDDRHRIAHLRKLYARLQEHKGIDVIQEFKEIVLDAGDGREGEPS